MYSTYQKSLLTAEVDIRKKDNDQNWTFRKLDTRHL